MNKKSIFTILIILCVSSISLWAQNTIRGVVYDENGNTLPGATIIVPGTTQGVTTDVDGEFSLQLPEGENTIEVSFIGYLPESVDVSGKDYIEVTLLPSIEQLQEVVVTALGIKRESKALGYSVQQVGSEDFTNANRISPISGLVGQVAGLQIGETGSGPGGSSKILIRGANSLTKDNRPLFVIDGVPVDNSGGSSGGLFGGFDYGDAINNINLDDVESVSVLKGGAASALYGARGQNGVIMITTKSASSKKGLGISYQTMFSIQDPLIKPDFQTLYSQGASGSFGNVNPRSWGVKMEGQQVVNFLNQEQILNPVSGHPYDEFFRQGFSMDHSVVLDKRGELNGILFSASWNNSDGILPGNTIEKKSFNLRYDSQLSNYLTFDSRVNYINQQADNRPNLAGSPDNPIYLFTHKPASVGLDQLENYQTVNRMAVVWNSLYNVNEDGTIVLAGDPQFASAPLLNNPYWATNLNTNQDTRNRILGFARLDFDFTEFLGLNYDLNLTLKAGLDHFNDERERITAQNTYYKANGLATGSFLRLERTEANYDFLLSYGNQWGDFTLQASAGGNIMQQRSRSISASSESGLINVFGPYVIQNFENPVASNGISDLAIHSVYALANMDYKRMIFLDLTFRNDWTSVLAPEEWSYQYPSVSLSWLLEETFDLPGYIDMFKIRGSYAATGSGGSTVGQRYFQFGTNPSQYLGLPYGFFNSTRPEPLLRSEYTVSQEAGIQLIMFGNRLNADLAFYQTGTRDQIFDNPLPPSSGFNSGLINSGFVNNSGVELVFNYKIIDTPDFSWTSGFNVTRQWSKVEELNEEINFIQQGGVAGVTIRAVLDNEAGVIYGTAFDRDDNGNMILDEQNLPRIKLDESGALATEVIGYAMPDFLWGFNSRFNYKNIFLNFQIDSKTGHDIFSVSNRNGAEFGTLAFTTEGRDEWYQALEISEITGVPPTDGFMVQGIKDGVEGEYPVDPQRYWDRLTRINEAFVYDASYIRFRQLAIGYNFEGSLLANTPFRNLSLSLFANNLFYIMKSTENISPESAFGTGNNVGYELYAYPELRSVGLNLKLSL